MSVGREKITIRSVDQLQIGETIWDSELNGFGVRCQKRSKSYILKTRFKGRQRFLTIGRHGQPWTPKMARDEAKKLLGEIARGVDPSEEARRGKQIQTVAILADDFYAKHIKPKLKPKTAYHYKSLLETYIKPMIGKYRVDELTSMQVEKFHNGLSKTPFQANRALAVLSKMFAWAEKHGIRAKGTNPVKGIERFPERARDRFLTGEELARVGEALNQIEVEGMISTHAIAAIRLLMFTGCRVSEILTLKWQDVQTEKRLLLLPDSKTGRKVIHLNGAAIEILKNLPRIVNNPYVIIGLKTNQHFENLSKVWRKVRERARLEPIENASGKIQQVRLHDLRHTFASMAAAGGASLPMIGKLLGHTQAQTTARYAHLAADPLREVNEKAGSAITNAMMRRKTVK